MTITVEEVSLPEHVVERYLGEGPSHVTRTTFEELPGGRTPVSMTAVFTVPWWNLLLRLALRPVVATGVAQSLSKLKALAES